MISYHWFLKNNFAFFQFFLLVVAFAWVISIIWEFMIKYHVKVIYEASAE